MPYSTGNSDGVRIYEKTADGYAIRATVDSGVPPTTASIFAIGCVCVDLQTGTFYRNQGTVAVPVWVIN